MRFRHSYIPIVLSVILSSPASPAPSSSFDYCPNSPIYIVSRTHSAQYDLHMCGDDKLVCCTACMNVYGYCNGGQPSISNACARQFNDCIVFNCRVPCPNNNCMGSLTPSRGHASHVALSEFIRQGPACEVK